MHEQAVLLNLSIYKILYSNTPVEIMIKQNTIDQTAHGYTGVSHSPHVTGKLSYLHTIPPAGVWRRGCGGGVVIGQVADTLFCQYHTDYRATGLWKAGVIQP